jgi:hypothetical protein
VYISSGDKYASKVTKQLIVKGVDNSTEGSDVTHFNPWSQVQSTELSIVVSSSLGVLFSYCLIANIPASADLATTPIAYTRGLKESGLWDKKYGLYGESGGFVVFADGHCKWFDGNKPAKFLKWDRSGYTSNIREAVPTGALFGNGGIIGPPKAPYDTLVLWGNGSGGE